MSEILTPKRHRRRPRRALIGAGIVAIPIAGFLAFAFLRAQSGGGAAQAWQYVATIGTVSAVLGVCLFFFGALRTGSIRREKGLRRLGTLQWMEGSFTTSQLRQRVALLDDPDSTSAPTEPIWTTISIDQEGLKLWSGDEDAKEYVSLPWRKIDNASSAYIVDYPRRSRGFSIDVTTDDGRRYKLEIPLLGRGLFGIAQAYPEDIDELVAAIRSRT